MLKHKKFHNPVEKQGLERKMLAIKMVTWFNGVSNAMFSFTAKGR